jgi:orotidine-5'-phosphate decarboxylase
MAELIVALDVENADAAWRLLDRLPAATWVKVGSILFAREGPALVRALRRRGLEVFLDLKWHDIPNTVAEAVRGAVDLDVRMANVHALGGSAMMAAAAEAAGDTLGMIAVTVLTSHDPESFGAAVGRVTPDLTAEVLRLAAAARAAGLRGVVCSPHEVAAVRSVFGPDGWIVVPGIRRDTDAGDDQRRTAAPEAATRAGATHLVVGRPVLRAVDPGAAFSEMQEAMACAS